ncbi:TPA: hypothetical protein N2902_001985 [Vibrio parahaemolyticus]|uniref:hypothetical protein n=1 Tax=Vibrio TaxID=662 RepID=UPI00186A05A8|nr:MULTISPECIES: hypothetical protein [Vibrio]EGQ8808816.1 hypothetical protein [Vibrio parahaemolyticus]EGQ8893108.1 hypothetical protein [Vibrio parahaemolyticus]EGQ8967197.1 hypothetical protein [Vibrio parahaemolyticus]EGR2854841.1 hypothetical protein [Vibrio parahaemolyticus]EGR3169369.1 hypothetical protein [Vibrio parahaemolyticus]
MWEYFYIFCSLASLCAFVGYIYDCFKQIEKIKAYGLVGLLVVLTALFWGWFFFFPENSVKQAIEDKRTFTVKHYRSPSDVAEISRIDSDFTTGTSSSEQVIMFESSFAEPPEVYIYRPDDIDSFYDMTPIDAKKITTQGFTIQVYSSGQSGPWKYRALGRLLQEVEVKP